MLRPRPRQFLGGGFLRVSPWPRLSILRTFTPVRCQLFGDFIPDSRLDPSRRFEGRMAKFQTTMHSLKPNDQLFRLSIKTDLMTHRLAPSDVNSVQNQRARCFRYSSGRIS